ncbi:hypothetical protein GGS20DRAFT_579026 [Poronia punctata]|nr:hypothetical protein GGS20DRAFT_579026 [Poronia punctata]
MIKQSSSEGQKFLNLSVSKTEGIPIFAERDPAYGGAPHSGEADLCKEYLKQGYARHGQDHSPDRRLDRITDLMAPEGKAAVASGRINQEVPEGKRELTPEEFLAHRKVVFVEKTMVAFQRWLDKRLAIISYTIEAAEASDSQSSGSGGGGSGDSQYWDVGEKESGGGGSRPPKRQFSGDNPDDFAGGDGNGQDRGGNKRAKKDAEPEAIFACPFHKHNPKMHRRAGCVTGGWKTIHRLKEHLYRVHLLPKHNCPRCQEPFACDKALQDHLRADEPCKKRNMVLEEGIDLDTEKKLRERKKHNSSETETQRWKDIYLLLFPSADRDAIPSPYRDYDGVKRRSTRENFKRVEKHLKKELPQIVKKKLVKRVGVMEDKLLNEMNDLVRHSVVECMKALLQDDTSSPTSAQTSRATTPGLMPVADDAPAPPHDQAGSEYEFDMGEYLNSEDLDIFGIGSLGYANFAPETDDGRNMYGTDKLSDSGYGSSTTLTASY